MDNTENTLLLASASRLSRAIADREVTAVEACSAVFDRIRALNPILRAYTSLFEEAAMDSALSADRIAARRSGTLPCLLGVPVAVKASIAVKGKTTTAGAPRSAHARPARADAVVTSRLRRAGAAIIGALAMDEYAAGLLGRNAHFGDAHNPWHLDHFSGGSSAGSAVAVASALAAGTVGTDTCGSIRVPSSFCGVVGLRPTRLLIPTRGITPLARSLDTVGPMARSISDVKLLFDSLSVSSPTPATERSPRSRLSFGVLDDDQLSECTPTVATAYATVVSELAPAHKVARIRLPELPLVRAAATIITAAEAGAYHREGLAQHPSAYSAEVGPYFLAGAEIPSRMHSRAQAARKVVAEAMAAPLRELDAIVMPATPCTAPRMTDELSCDLGTFCYAASLAGIPVLTAPIGVDNAGLPTAISLCARAGDDQRLLQIGELLERLGVIRPLGPVTPLHVP